jgi:Na+/H+ antiporter NhaD/arsenite permease-like protein
MIVLFLAAYLLIASEHKFKIDKAAVALLSGGILWVIYIMFLPESVSVVNSHAFTEFLKTNHDLNNLSLADQCRKFIINHQIIEVLGEISGTLFFLIGAMTIVEIIDVHGGFHLITGNIKAKSKRGLLWIVTFITFFMSAVLDNMTTSIVMIMLLRRIITDHKLRWIFGSMIIIAANSGGAWSPIGDVTTIMLWVKETVNTGPLVTNLIIPSLVSTLVPLIFLQYRIKGDLHEKINAKHTLENESVLSIRERGWLLVIGISALLFVPVFKSITHLPPFVGVLIGLSIVWIYTEILFKNKLGVDEGSKHRVTRIIRRIDTPTILFFLGILMAVNALQATGILNSLGHDLNNSLKNIYAINLIIGIVSAIIDNVPLVAMAIGMYPVVDPATLSTVADPLFLQHFIQDGDFWLFLAYCSGVGGSIFIIGSVAGVVIMGIEKMNFSWYLKNISLLAFAGYLAGAAIFILTSIYM